jgi:hypothetical protein
LACNQDSPRSDLGVDFCFGGFDPTPNFGVGLEKANFLWENEKNGSFREEGN